MWHIADLLILLRSLAHLVILKVQAKRQRFPTARNFSVRPIARASRSLMLRLTVIATAWATAACLNIQNGSTPFAAYQAQDVYCGKDINSGQIAGMCGLVGTRIPLYSAPALFAGGRFSNFSLGAASLSSERNVQGIVSDFTLESSLSSARVDASKLIRGYAQVALSKHQLFVCMQHLTLSFRWSLAA
jgi:hypothetical protein